MRFVHVRRFEANDARHVWALNDLPNVGLGGIRPTGGRRAEVLRVRVHPATRRRGVGRRLMTALEARAAELGVRELHLDTATNQPEAVAFYRALGYEEIRQETRPEWRWTLVYFVKRVTA